MATATNGTDTYRRMKQLAATSPAIAERLKLADYRVLEELYHVASDPDCLHNLISVDTHQATAETLRGQLSTWMEQTGDPMLEVFKRRDSSDYLANFMKQQQAEASERRAVKPAKNRANARRQAARQE